MNTRPSNVEFVTHLMEHSRHGVLMQMFVMRSLEQHASLVASAYEAGGLVMGDNSFITADSWGGCAIELREAIKERLGS